MERYYIDYSIKDGAEAASNLEIIRNFVNAIRKARGTVLYTPEDKDYTIGEVVKGCQTAYSKTMTAKNRNCGFAGTIFRRIFCLI